MTVVLGPCPSRTSTVRKDDLTDFRVVVRGDVSPREDVEYSYERLAMMERALIRHEEQGAPRFETTRWNDVQRIAIDASKAARDLVRAMWPDKASRASAMARSTSYASVASRAHALLRAPHGDALETSL